jgi:RNA polymerase sigma-70 factor (ECF subfamily)
MSTDHVRLGDETDALWRAHSTRLIAYATYLVGPGDAHDVVADAFIRVASQAVDGRIEQPDTYLLRAVRNQANSLRRSRSRRWKRDLAGIGPASITQQDSYAEVRRAIAQLSLAQRSVVFLVYWEDRTEADAAELLGISQSTVRRHLERARIHLRKGLI